MPRPPPPPEHVTEGTATFPPEMIQQAMHRLFVAYNQCVTRVAQTDDRLEQFSDALDMALTVQRTGQDVQHQQQAIEQIRSTLFEDVQERVKSLEERLRSVMDHEVHVNKTSHVMSLNSEPQKTQDHTGSLQVAREQYRHSSYEALISHHLANDEPLWDNLPVPSVADPTVANLVRPKTLLVRVGLL